MRIKTMVEVAKYVALAVLVLVIALALVYLPKARLFGGTHSPGKTANSTTSSSTEQTSLSSTSLTTVATSTVGKYCTPNSTFVYVQNGNFSNGTYSGWAVSGGSFGNAPLNLVKANQNGNYSAVQWSGYQGVYAATSFNPKSKRTPGSISASFIALEPYLNFQIYSPKSSLLYVQIISDSGSKSYYYDTLDGQGTNVTSRFAYASIGISQYNCQTITVKVVSDTGPLDDSGTFIAAGNFYQSEYPFQTPGIAVNAS